MDETFYLMPVSLMEKIIAIMSDPRTVAPTGPTLVVIRELGTMKTVHLDVPPEGNHDEPGEGQDDA